MTSSPAGAVAADEELGRLVEACQAQDAAALRELYRRMSPMLMGVALRLLRDRPQAEEVLQEAFLQVWRNAARFDRARGSAKAWMIGIVRYRALDRIDSERRQPANGGEIPDIAAEMPVAVEDGRALAACLGELPEHWRRAVVLSFVDGYSHSEIAERTDTPLGTVKSWISRALGALKRCLER
ncbi:RNA polymerase sigma factor [Acidiphilium sp.]|uniref:RNA polymerase sigma factor n=1 Tax=Acidiphilium sp. TaxID=527 RepID=UPI003CFD0C5B